MCYQTTGESSLAYLSKLYIKDPESRTSCPEVNSCYPCSRWHTTSRCDYNETGEPFCMFAARVQGKAESCKLETTLIGHCSKCHTAVTGEIYYTYEVIHDVLLNGIADLGIHFETFSKESIQTKSKTGTIAFVKTRETACNANPASALQPFQDITDLTKIV